MAEPQSPLSWSYDGVVLIGWGREAQGASRFLDAFYPDCPVLVLYEGEGAPDLPTGITAQSQADFLSQGLALDMAAPLVLRSPGIAPGNRVIVKLESLGADITTPTGYWLSLQGRDRLITVTGTKGKSTTVSLITHILRAGGINAVSVGNIGAPPLDDRPFEVDVVVAELSSYQLHDAMGAGRVHVITNLYREHTDWHGGHEAYAGAKMAPAGRFPDLTVLSQPEILAALPAQHTGARLAFEDYVPADLDKGEIYLPHQAALALTPLNARLAGSIMTQSVRMACAAILAGEHLTPGALYQALITGLPSWTPLPHRLETIGEIGKVAWIDDSLATVPEAVMSAIQVILHRPLHLIMGGRHRGQDWTQFCEHLQTLHNVRLYLFGTIAEEVAEGLNGVGIEEGFHTFESFEAAIQAAHLASQTEGGAVVFSPGAASEGVHANYEHRSGIFRLEWARALAEHMTAHSKIADL
ncbi:UDP-N-acetylmuramoyl-L-alanine--D-glutamate ligase [Woodsholea maritima]|uniref:UDP-N-acetylmuramoyl-L-alanine--D-glutamate ligase n=1 Tax=Woodsholea maritima TaxID=240237 RepID=UPI00037A934B|nr:UDP-N-acetylmuramoyl-L-alanine--D-glutamate ligase [Woodsholea maritima]